MIRQRSQWLLPNAPDSATRQFFINFSDNDFLNAKGGNPGYAVFGTVTEGFDVVQKMATIPTKRICRMSDIPADPIIILGLRNASAIHSALNLLKVFLYKDAPCHSKFLSWMQTFRSYLDKRLLWVFMLGCSSGFPWVLDYGSNMSGWLKDAGLTRAAIGYFGSVFAVYAINFLWAPLVDRVKLPILHAMLGQRAAVGYSYAKALY